VDSTLNRRSHTVLFTAVHSAFPRHSASHYALLALLFDLLLSVRTPVFIHLFIFLLRQEAAKQYKHTQQKAQNTKYHTKVKNK